MTNVVLSAQARPCCTPVGRTTLLLDVCRRRGYMDQGFGTRLVQAAHDKRPRDLADDPHSGDDLALTEGFAPKPQPAVNFWCSLPIYGAGVTAARAGGL